MEQKEKVQVQPQSIFPVEITTYYYGKYGARAKANSRVRFANVQNKRVTVDTISLKSERKSDKFKDLRDPLNTYYDKKRKPKLKDDYDFRFITMPNGKTFFHKRTHTDVARALAYGELLYNQIANAVGANALKYYAVMDDGKRASEADMTVMSEMAYDEKTEKLITLPDLAELVGYDFHFSLKDSVENIYKLINFAQGKQVEVDHQPVKLSIATATKLNLFKMYVLDCITLQTDRRNSNIQFMLNKNTGKVRTSALMDNGWLEPLMTDDMIQKETPYGSHGEFAFPNPKAEEMRFEQIAKRSIANLKLRLKTNDTYELYTNYPAIDRLKDRADDTVRIAKTIPGATQFLIDLTTKLNAEEAIAQTSHDIGFDLPKIEKDNLIKTINLTTGLIRQSLNSTSRKSKRSASESEKGNCYMSEQTYNKAM